MATTIKKQDLLNALANANAELQRLTDLIEKATSVKTVKTNALATKVAKPKAVATKVAKSTKAVATKVAKPRTNTLTTKVVTTQPKQGWSKFDWSNLPKAYTFLKVTFKDGSKSVFGSFKHTMTKDNNLFVTVVNRYKQEFVIAFQDIKAVYEYHR